MATIVDRLIIELGLDPTHFNRGQKQAAAALLKTKQDLDKTTKDIEQHTKNMGVFFSRLRTQIVSAFAVFTAGKGIKEFVSDLTTTNASLGRLAPQLGTTTAQLSLWRGAFERAGGSVEGITSVIGGLISEQQKFMLTGESGVIPYLRALERFAPGLASAFGKGDWASTLMHLSEAFSKMQPQQAAAFGRALGIDPDTLSVLLKGPTALRAWLVEQEKFGKVTAEDAKAAQGFQEALRGVEQSSTTLGRNLFTTLSPALIQVLKSLSELAIWAQSKPQLVERAFMIMAAAVGAFMLAIAPMQIAIAAIVGAIAAIVGFSESEEEKQQRMEDRTKRQSQFNTPGGNTIGARRGGNVQGGVTIHATDPGLIKTVADEWTKAGMGEIGTAAALGNIGPESAWNAGQRTPDQYKWAAKHPESPEGLYAHGLWSEGADEWLNYDRWLKENHPGGDWKDPKLQSEFTAWNVKTNYPRLWQMMKDSTDERQAAYLFERMYLKPGITHSLQSMSSAHQMLGAIEAARQAQAEKVPNVATGGAGAAGTNSNVINNSRSSNSRSDVRIGSINAYGQSDPDSTARAVDSMLNRNLLGVGANGGPQ